MPIIPRSVFALFLKDIHNPAPATAGLANFFVGATRILLLYVWEQGASKRTKTEPSCFSPLNELSPLCDAG